MKTIPWLPCGLLLLAPLLSGARGEGCGTVPGTPDVTDPEVIDPVGDVECSKYNLVARGEMYPEQGGTVTLSWDVTW